MVKVNMLKSVKWFLTGLHFYAPKGGHLVIAFPSVCPSVRHTFSNVCALRLYFTFYIECQWRRSSRLQIVSHHPSYKTTSMFTSFSSTHSNNISIVVSLEQLSTEMDKHFSHSHDINAFFILSNYHQQTLN